MTPEEFGELIRTHREAKGLSIEELASRFKLSVSTVRGIEAGSLDHMPHAVYARGFVRAYAQAVDVPLEDLNAGLAALFPEEIFADVPTVPGPLSGKPPKPERNGGNIARALVALLVIAALGGGAWYGFSRFDDVKEFISRSLPSTSPAIESSPANAPERETPRQSPAGNVSPATAQPAPAPRVPETAVSSALAPPQSVEQAREEPVRPQTAAAPEPAPEARPAAPDAADSSLVSGKQVAIEATEECWVQVSVDGGGLRTFTVYPGETSVLPYKNRMTLVLGNTGGVAITHNGKAFPNNGKRNEKKTFTFQ